MTLAALLALWRARIAEDRAAGRNIQAQVRSEDADELESALAGGHYNDCNKCGLAISHGTTIEYRPAQQPDEPAESETK